MTKTAKRSTSLTLDRDLLDEAKALGVNVSRAAEKGITADLKVAREAKWRADNREAISKTNAYIEEHGIPFADQRKF